MRLHWDPIYLVSDKSEHVRLDSSSSTRTADFFFFLTIGLSNRASWRIGEEDVN